MRVWPILPQPNLGRIVEPNEFRAKRDSHGDGRGLVKNIFERFPSQPAMPISHPAMQGDSAMFAGRKPIFMMHPIDGQYFPYALKLSNKINAAKRSITTIEVEKNIRLNEDARAVIREQDNLNFRIETGAMHRLGQSAIIKAARLFAMDKLAVARSVGIEAANSTANDKRDISTSLQKPLQRLEAALAPAAVETAVILAAQGIASAVVAVNAYQSASLKQLPTQTNNILGTVPAVAAVSFKI